MGKPKALQGYVATSSFAQHALVACFSVSASPNTRKAYWTDTRNWLAFCEARGVDPSKPAPVAIIAWIEDMQQHGSAPKTRARRVAALSSVYDRLRRSGVVPSNPFSIKNGPNRETAVPIQPTPVAKPHVVRAILDTCAGGSFEDIRDAAMIRFLWSTGARRASLIGMTFERLQPDRSGYVAALIVKGNKEVRALVCGKAATALATWLQLLQVQGITKGAIWRNAAGATLDEKAVWTMLQQRAAQAGVEAITPHTFRVAFLTYNPAGLEAKQDAAGHADPATTRLYDRENWRGREAFEAMPEVEDLG